MEAETPFQVRLPRLDDHYECTKVRIYYGFERAVSGFSPSYSWSLFQDTLSLILPRRDLEILWTPQESLNFSLFPAWFDTIVRPSDLGMGQLGRCRCSLDHTRNCFAPMHH